MKKHFAIFVLIRGVPMVLPDKEGNPYISSSEASAIEELKELLKDKEIEKHGTRFMVLPYYSI